MEDAWPYRAKNKRNRQLRDLGLHALRYEHNRNSAKNRNQRGRTKHKSHMPPPDFIKQRGMNTYHSV
jgi:hypothetical protein